MDKHEPFNPESCGAFGRGAASRGQAIGNSRSHGENSACQQSRTVGYDDGMLALAACMWTDDSPGALLIPREDPSMTRFHLIVACRPRAQVHAIKPIRHRPACLSETTHIHDLNAPVDRRIRVLPVLQLLFAGTEGDPDLSVLPSLWGSQNSERIRRFQPSKRSGDFNRGHFCRGQAPGGDELIDEAGRREDIWSDPKVIRTSATEKPGFRRANPAYSER